MIAAQGLTKYYGDKCAIQNLNFEIASGEIVGILGLNGAGKTTTLRVLACLLLPSNGKVTINGLDVSEHPHEIRKQVGFLPEVPPLYQEMTVESYLCFAGELRGLSHKHATSRVQEVMELTHTKEVRSEVIAHLSHGYRQRVGIGQAIVHQPPVLILDEPISGLDPVQIVEMREMIKGLKGRHTILLSSHILPEISQTCDRILVIQDGQIKATGTEEELTSHMSKGSRLNLVVRGAKDKVLSLLQAMPHVTSSKVTSEHGEVLHLRVITDEDVREVLSRELIQAGMGLLGLGPAEGELETIFIQLTQKQEVSQ
jgi:ABC-2 type transport system ATP-binding protein